MSNYPPSQPWPPRAPNMPPSQPWNGNIPPSPPSQPWRGNVPNMPPSQPWHGGVPATPPSRPWEGSPSKPMPPGIDMSRQYPPGHPWHDATPSQLPPHGQRSAPWIEVLDEPTLRTPSSPYRPWVPQEAGSEGFYAPPPPAGGRGSGPVPRRRRNSLMAVMAVLVVMAFAGVAFGIAQAHPTKSLLAATSTSTAVLGAATIAPTALVGTLAPSPTVASKTPTPQATATATKVATATPIPALPVSYDDTAVGTGPNKFNFQGIWSQSSDAGYYGGSDSYSNDSAASVTLSFTGTRIQLIVDTNYNLGIYGIHLDGGTEVDKDGYSASLGYKVPLYDSGALAKGSHILKVFVTGRKGNGSDTYIDVDAVKVTP